MIIYRPLTQCVPQFVGGPIGSWGPRLKPIYPIGKTGIAFDYKYFGLANFWRFFESLWLQLCGLAKCTTCVFACITYTFICRFTIFKLADENSWHQMKVCKIWKYKYGIEHFLSNMLANYWNWLFRNIWKMLKTNALSGEIQGER